MGTPPRPVSLGTRPLPLRSRIICERRGALGGARDGRQGVGGRWGGGGLEGACTGDDGGRGPEHLIEAAAIFGGRELGSFVHREPHVRLQGALPGRAVEPAGRRRGGCWRGETWAAGGRAPATSPTHSNRCPAAGPPLPLHVGVLQGLGRAEPLVGGKHQGSLAVVQDLWGGVGRQEGVQCRARPVGSRPISRSRVRPPLPAPCSLPSTTLGQRAGASELCFPSGRLSKAWCSSCRRPGRAAPTLGLPRF